jgi:ATP/maltotriose-dependent transcriptional regulator MalT
MHTRGKEAAVHLEQAYEAIEEPVQRAEVAFSLARTLNFTRAPVEANAVARRAIEELPDGLEDMRHALEAIELMTVVFGGAPRDQLTRLEAYRKDLVGDGPGARMLAAISAFYWSNTGGTAEECVALARSALADDVLIKHDNGLYWVTANVVLVYADDERALEVWESARREAHRNGSLFAILSVNLWRGWNLLRWGDLAEAEESLLAAAEEMSLWGSEAGTVNEYPAAFLTETRIERGDLVGARAALDASGKFDAKGDGANFWRGSRAELLFNEGKLEQALEACDEYREGLMQYMNPTPHPWRTLRAVILDRLGRTDEGIELAAEEVELARGWGAPGALGRALRTQGTLMREDGLDLLREAVDVLDGSPSRLQLAKALCALGTAERLARRQTEAREPLRRALELADVCGAEPLAERARTELQATGARPRTTALSGVDALTPSEKRVADLAAAGMSNREIAQELYVTPKTVEVHLSNTYRKLEIGGRRELPPALATG